MNKLVLGLALLVVFGLIYFQSPLVKNITDKIRKVKSGGSCGSCGACGLKEQYINPIKFIDQVFTFLSRNDKIVLKNNCIKNEYITPDVPNEVEDEVNEALSMVISKSNKLCCSYFVLRRKNLIMVERNEQGERYVVDGVFHETVGHFTIRFVLDYIKLGNNRYINYITIANTSVYNLMQPPANSSTSKNNLAKDKSASLVPLKKSQFNEDWMDRLSDLYNEKYTVIGIDDSTLESNPVDYVELYDIFNLEDANKWVIPFDQMGRNSDFCKKESLMWDRFGANLAVSVGDGCLMNNTAYQKRNVLPNVGSEKVGVITEYGDPDNSANAWLFNSGEFGNVRVETGIAGKVG